MSEKIKKGDFIEIEYTGKFKSDGKTFDTTDADLAKKEKVFNKTTKYGPIIICVGENHILPGIDENLLKGEVGKTLKIDVSPEKGFGKKNPKLLKIVPKNIFQKNNIKPVPGLQLNLDGVLAQIKTVSGGRVVVDFNHPYSGKDLVYEVKIKRKIEKTDEKIKSFVSLMLKMNEDIIDVKFDKGNAEIKFSKIKVIPKEIEKKLVEKLKKSVPEVKDVKIKFEEKNKSKKSEKKDNL